MPVSPTTSRGGFVRTAAVALTNAQILTLPTTPVELVAAPGSGRRLVLVSVYMRSAFVAGYTNVTGTGPLFGGAGLVVTHGPDDSDASTMRSLTIFAAAAVREWDALGPAISTAADVALGYGGAGTDQSNKALNVVVRNAALGNFTGGNAANILRVSIAYLTVDTATGVVL